MDGFIGRDDELRYLEDMYSRKGLKTCSVYGRRQVGKSTLLSEFCKGKESIIVQAIDSSPYENKTLVSAAITRKVLGEPKYIDSYVAMMDLYEQYCKEKKVVLVFDEYPFLVRSSPEFASVLQRFIDTQIKGTDTMLIICGSSISSMCDETQSYDRPLYGRMIKYLEVKEIGFGSCLAFHEKMSHMDALKTYLILGGVPKYHSLYDERTFSNVIRKHFIPDNNGIRQEAQSLITMDLQSSVYVGIVACIADGSVVQYEIADKLGIDRPACKRHLDNLERIRIVERKHPMFNAPSRPIYRIRDSYVAFYYEVIRKYESDLSNSVPFDTVYRDMLPDIDTFLGRRFEDLCRRYIVDRYSVSDIGTWWARDGSGEIDIVAKVMDAELRTSYIVSECKFTKDRMTLGVFQKLKDLTEGICGLDNVRFVLFSVNGFDRRLEEYAGPHGIELVSLEQIVDWPEARRLRRRTARKNPFYNTPIMADQ